AAPIATTQPMTDTQVKEALASIQRPTVVGTGTQAAAPAPSTPAMTAYAEPQALARGYPSAPGFASGSQVATAPIPRPPKKGPGAAIIALAVIGGGAIVAAIAI